MNLTTCRMGELVSPISAIAFLSSPWPWPQRSGTGAGIMLNKTLNLQVSPQETTLKSVIIFSSFAISIRAESSPTGITTVLRLPLGFWRWAPNIAGEKLKKKRKKKITSSGFEPGTPTWISKHFTTRTQQPVISCCSIRVLSTYTLWLPFDLHLSENQTLIHRFLTSITMLQRQNDHVDNYNGLWLNGKIHRLSNKQNKKKKHLARNRKILQNLFFFFFFFFFFLLVSCFQFLNPASEIT